MSLAPYLWPYARSATRALTRSLGVTALTLAGLGAPAAADADLDRGPDPLGALRTLAEAPPTLVANSFAAGGLVMAAGVALTGDAISLVDANPATRPVLRGVASRAVRRLALAISWTATGALEGLRVLDVERLPEARATYLEAAPGVGRFDTLLDGLGAARLAVGDLLGAPWLATLQLIGSAERAEAFASRRRDARIRFLGPEPAPK